MRAKHPAADPHEDVRDVMSVEQAAQFLRVSPLAVYEAAHDGDLPAVWEGAEPLIDRRRLLLQLDPEWAADADG